MIKKTIKIFLAIFLFVFVVSCSNKEQKNDFNKLSNEEKIAYLDARIKQEPKNAELYYQRAKVFQVIGNTKEALFNIRKAIEFNKKKTDYYLLEADIFFERGETSMSFDALNQAIKIDKKNIDAYLKMVEISIDLQDYNRGMESIKNVLDIDKVNARAYFMRGWIFKETGDTLRAVEDYKKAIEYKSDYEYAFEELGNLYAIKGDGLAVDYYKSTININPKNINAMYNLGLFYQEHGSIQQALDMYKRVLDISPSYTNAIYAVGYINFEEKQDYNTALDCFNKAIKSDTTYYEAYQARAKVYEKLGQHNQAQQDMEKYTELKPKYTQQ
ncbi:MAG: tetratricopeptide repeat protein [Bacteroidales bacterium]|nr:tetratricopeptide repeat protein [Bacteroidales bacterium]